MSGRRTWIVQWRDGARTRRHTIGDAADIDRASARVVAQTILAAPSDAVVPERAPLFAAFAETFLADCAPRWKPATYATHRSQLRTVLLPAFGSRRVDTIARSDVVDWFSSPTGDNRALSLLSTLMRHAEALAHRPDGSNPCVGLRRRRSRFEAGRLTRDTYRSLSIALDGLNTRHPNEVALIRFLMSTGARRGEVLGMTWSDITDDRVIIQDGKSGPKVIWLPAAVIALLPPRPHSKPLASVFKSTRSKLEGVWHRALQRAGIPQLRLHDLRHGYASVAVSAGEDLATVGVLLGHRDFGTTRGYAHLATGAVSAAASRVSRTLARAIAPKTGPGTSARLPVLPVEEVARTPDERMWAGHINAYRRQRQPLQMFCAARGLDRSQFRRVLDRLRLRLLRRDGRPR